MEQQHLMDNNVVVDFFNGKLPQKGKKFMASLQPVISVITHIELLSNRNVPPQELIQIQGFIDIALIHPLESQVIVQTIILRLGNRLKTPDAIIAATALSHNLVLITRNGADFKNIAGLKIVNPHTLF